ncbi:hypothetical protein [Micromonospora noduli]|uniref:Uncharacterized protein n=1 Tax=Micromonospora noduli TaxID=709876 RepID=A0A328N4D9_9ACTN|nr:hypothetical protein [Micromonospora noduli]RAN96518.1 hypothetical protein LAH08_05261 [Micromonospora noduli]RAO08903.1 hypothetical protein MED15_06367 [Micromonospora noduli]
MVSVHQLDLASADAAITKEFVQRWSGRYQVKQREFDVFGRIGPVVVNRGYYNRRDLLEVVRWKSPRSTTYVDRNSDSDIEDVTRMALAAPQRLRHRVLSLLNGVGVPIASALLTVCEPSVFTVIDYRAIETLRAHGELGRRSSYTRYLEVCSALADRVETDLRTLDRALWQWSKEKGKSFPPTVH